ncbi:sulfurtransferase TusA family protein [Kingella kingae]|uniref:sulfurtransferase TusA family protein n=2 Tax=Kingella kingae TaxID=504 RepID=UPI0003FEB25D|nr:sulfurtransferase TusA family protein [Kingella kingae]
MNNETLLDLSGLKCPLPILRTKKALATLPSGTILTVLATDAGAPDDFAAFCKHTGHELLQNSEENGVFTLVVKRKKKEQPCKP